MKKLLLACVLAGALGVAPAQEPNQRNQPAQATPSPPSPDQASPSSVYVPSQPPSAMTQQVLVEDTLTVAYTEVNVKLLDIIRKLTDQGSVDNELKFEESNHLTPGQVYVRRLSIINSCVDNLRTAKGVK